MALRSCQLSNQSWCFYRVVISLYSIKQVLKDSLTQIDFGLWTIGYSRGDRRVCTDKSISIGQGVLTLVYIWSSGGGLTPPPTSGATIRLIQTTLSVSRSIGSNVSELIRLGIWSTLISSGPICHLKSGGVVRSDLDRVNWQMMPLYPVELIGSPEDSPQGPYKGHTRPANGQQVSAVVPRGWRPVGRTPKEKAPGTSGEPFQQGIRIVNR